VVMFVEVQQKVIQLDRRKMGETRDQITRRKLSRWITEKVSAGPDSTFSVTIASSLQDEVHNFSERLASGAVANLATYFARRHIEGFTVGGRRSANHPLLYDAESQQPSGADIGAIGEGIAGWYLEQVEGLSFEVRPFRVSPDLIFLDRTKRYILTEVKAMLDTSPLLGKLPDTSCDIIDLMTKTHMIRQGGYFGYFISVRALAPDHFELYRLALEEQVPATSGSTQKLEEELAESMSDTVSPSRSRSPKRMQQERAFDEALGGFAQRYVASWRDGDEYMRSQYLDEVARTICFKHDGQVRYGQLEHEIEEAMRSALDHEPLEKSELWRVLKEDCELVQEKFYGKS